MGEEAAVTARSFPPVVSENIIVLPVAIKKRTGQHHENAAPPSDSTLRKQGNPLSKPSYSTVGVSTTTPPLNSTLSPATTFTNTLPIALSLHSPVCFPVLARKSPSS